MLTAVNIKGLRPKNSHFSLSKEGPKPDLDLIPPNLHQNVSNIIANTPGKLLAPEGSFWKSKFWQEFHPAHLGTSCHKLSMQGCLDIYLA